MRAQYGPWLRNTGISLVTSALLSSYAWAAGTMTDGQKAGASVGATVSGMFGNKEGFNSNISKPLTSSNTPLKTTDGSIAFSANIAMPSSAKFLELLIQPSGTGDLQKAMFSIDTNMDGTPDHVYQPPRLVSGVCGNGYISCNPGTWANCFPYKWVSDPNGQLSDESVAVTKLGGCYCINSSCGSSLVWNNAGVVLKDLAGGAVAAIQRANIGFMVSNVSTTPVSIAYYGRLTNSATVASTNTTTTLPLPAQAQDYYTNPGNLSSEVNNLVVSSNTDPSSLYSLLASSQAAKSAMKQQKSCSIDRNGWPETVSEDIGFDLRFYTGYDPNGSTKECFWTKDDMSCMDVWFSGAQGWEACKTTSLANTGKIVEKLLPGTVPTGFTCAQVDIVNVIEPPNPHPGCYGSGDNSTHAFYNVHCFKRLPFPGAVVVFDTPLIREKRDDYKESITDGCASLAMDTTCKIQAEEVDGVQTVANYNSTGLNPLPSCQSIAGSVGPFDICRPWWKKKRTYVCESSSNWDFSDIGKRFGTVRTSVQQSGNNISFDDKIKNKDGTWTNSGGLSLSLISTPAGDSCEKACKTRVPREDNQVTVAGLNSTIRLNNSDASDFMYRTCINNVCPVDKPGEIIVSDCECNNSFTEAASAIQSMRLAGKDTICTTGTPKPLK